MCTLPSFVKDDQFLEGLKFELLDQIFYEKNNDLYTFQQVRINILYWSGKDCPNSRRTNILYVYAYKQYFSIQIPVGKILIENILLC